MKEVVIDNSVVMSWLFTDESTGKSQDLLRNIEKMTVYVPSLWLYELTNVLFIAERKGRIKEANSIAFLNLLKSLPIKLQDSNYDIITRDVLAISREHHVTVYDASYIELAARKSLPLASYDQEIIKACRKIGVKII